MDKQLRDASKLVIKLNEREFEAITARWQNEGSDLGLSTWARRVLLNKDMPVRSQTILQRIAQGLADLDILDKNDESVKKFIHGETGR